MAFSFSLSVSRRTCDPSPPPLYMIIVADAPSARYVHGMARIEPIGGIGSLELDLDVTAAAVTTVRRQFVHILYRLYRP